MADISITTILQNGVTAINSLITVLKNVFPQTTGTSATATGGAGALPANPVAFLTVTHPTTGATILVPYYNP